MMRKLSLIRSRIHRAVNYRLRGLAGGRLSHLCRPTWISFVVTERCNARCTHCDIWKNRGREDGLSQEEWRKVLADIRHWLGPVHICITGGEALLIPGIPATVRYATDLGLLTEVLTHGYWNEQSRIEALAEANPWQITVSLDATSDTHSLIRGRQNFVACTLRTLDTLKRLRADRGLDYSILLKTVVLRQNLDEVGDIAEYARTHGLAVFYQAIEQNYNTPLDLRWYERSPNWPDDPDRAVGAVQSLIRMKEQGFPIANSVQQLQAMIPYFRDPAASQVAMRLHSAHESRQFCSALELLQIQPNGDVITCVNMPPAGNVRLRPVREIWQTRPRYWRNGCCRDKLAPA